MNAPARLTSWSVVVGTLGSLALHVAVYLLLRWLGTAPSLDIELTLPSTIEIGLTEAATPELAPAVSSPAVPEPVVPEAPTEESAPAEPVEPDAPDEQSPADAGTQSSMPDAAAAPVDAGAPVDAAIPMPGDAGTEGATESEPADAGRPLLAAFAPPGAQLALRLDVARVRASPLAEDISGLLAAIPDWKLVLGDSGIEPLRDLERLFLASPNLRRESLVIAGQHGGEGAELPYRAVRRLARAAKRDARWKVRNGVASAPWHDLDDTDRVIAIIGPAQFAITRPSDLPRIVTIARALAERQVRETGRGPKDIADALLALGPAETLAISVEGVRHFVRDARRGIPERLEASVRDVEEQPDLVELHATGVFTSPDAAADGESYWKAARDRVARHPLVAFTGMHGPIAGVVFEVEGERLHAHTRLTVHQARRVIDFLRESLAPPPAAPAPGGTMAPRRSRP